MAKKSKKTESNKAKKKGPAKKKATKKAAPEKAKKTARKTQKKKAIKVTMYHNPRCQTSRKVLALLQSKGIEPEIVLYLENPPSQKKLDELAKQMDVHPKDLVRKRDKLYKELGLNEWTTMNRREWIRVLSKNPQLLERPIVVCGSKAILARPPESVLEIL